MYRGSCACGQIHYQCEAEPYQVFYCHCLDCQKISGAPFLVNAVFPTEGLDISGRVSHWTRDSHGGGGVEYGFCATCGTTLFGAPSNYPSVMLVATGTMAQPELLAPMAHVWVSRKQAWLTIADDLPQFPENM